MFFIVLTVGLLKLLDVKLESSRCLLHLLNFIILPFQMTNF